MTTPLYLRALQGEDTPTAPMWFMRQAGRCLPEYRKLKETYTFWQLARTPELACEVTMQPIRRFGMDAAILFQDIMTPLPPMGVQIDFKPGPVIADPIRSLAQIEALRVPEAEEIAPFVPEAIKLIVDECPVPLIGFGGAPLTLATYLIQGSGSKDYGNFRAFLRQEPAAAHKLVEKLTEVSLRYLKTQVDAGAKAIQLFDSWAGLHADPVYREFSKPYNDRIFKALREWGVPSIYLAVGSTHLYPVISELECDAVSVDWRLPLSTIRKALPGKVLQGNLDPAVFMADKAVVKQEVERVLEAGRGGAHIFNLGHGMLPTADPEMIAYAIEVVRGFNRHA